MKGDLFELCRFLLVSPLVDAVPMECMAEENWVPLIFMRPAEDLGFLGGYCLTIAASSAGW